MADLCRGEDKDERRDLMTTGSFRRDREKETGGRSMRGKGSNRRIFDVDDCINFLHGSDPVRVELSRLQNQLRGSFVRSFGLDSFGGFLEFFF